jgi:cytochrome b involved in lipid metabolism
MRILASLLLTIALAGCAQTEQPAVTEMPSAQVDASQSETNTENDMGAEAPVDESSETDELSDQTTQPSAKPSNEPKQEEDTAEQSPSKSPTKTTEPSPTKTTEPSPTPTKTTEPSPTPTKTQSGYTMAQVAQRNSQSACWVVIDGMVYDLTEWIRSHPGGRGAILSLCGTDGTSSFNAQHAGRASVASVLGGYKLGPLGN